MASYTQVKTGSKGSSVSELQKLLNKNGYNLSVDGVFGQKTQAAVRDYQAKNNLAADGIAGNNTWSSLYGKSTASTSGSSKSSNKSTAEYLSSYETNKPAYTQSDAVTKAAELLAEYEKNKPGEYQSKYQEQIDALLDKIMNREEFSYDFNADPLYQQYADNYRRQGELAMMDTMGNAAALSGGYGNSYAQTAGQQAYQGYLSQLNSIIPELRNAAYQMYQGEGDTMYNNMNLLSTLDQSDYGKYRDTVSDYYNDLSYYYGKYNDMSESEYNRYLNDLSAWQNDRAYWYQKQQDEQAQANWEKQFALSQAAKSSGGSSGRKSSSKSSGSSYSKGYEKVLSDVTGMTFINAMARLDEAEAKGEITSKERLEIENIRNNMGVTDKTGYTSPTITETLADKKRKK